MLTRPDHIPAADWTTALRIRAGRVRYFRRRYLASPWIDTDVYEGLAWEMFLRTVGDWRPDGGAAFGTLVAARVNGRLMEETRRQSQEAVGQSKAQQRQVKRLLRGPVTALPNLRIEGVPEPLPAYLLPPLELDAPLVDDEADRHADLLAASDAPDVEAEWRLLARLLPKLVPAWERSLLLAHYVDGKTQRDLARLHGVSPATIGNVLARSRQAICGHAERLGWW